jgi:uncharacterized protein RhaS with RHS repeats
VQYEYNSAQRLERITDAAGRQTRYTYVDDTELPATVCPAVAGK